MAYSLTSLHLAATRATPISARTIKTRDHRGLPTQQGSNEVPQANRRNVTLILSTGMVLGLNLISGSGVSAATRRKPPPAPAEEKKDPNVSGVQAKVLASKKRKESMKETVTKLREKGKLIKEKSQD